MTKFESFDRCAIGRLSSDAPWRFLDSVVSYCREFDLPVEDGRPERVEMDTGIGTIVMLREGDGIAIEIRTSTEANAFMLRESVVARVEAVDANLVPSLVWAEPPKAGGWPPNFRVGRVASVTEYGPLFRRLIVRAENLEAFAQDGLHLRVLLPPCRHKPAWPGVDPAGRTRWPTGPDALHVAVYTIRHVDPARGTLTIDAFTHGRGRTCAWLEAATPGDQLGILGPGGGWLPSAKHLTLAGDETAIPAIARILESVPRCTVGTALVEVDHAAECPDIAAPPGLAVHRLERSAGQTLEHALASADLGPAGARHVWFAAEKRRASAMRQFLRQKRNVDRAESYVAAYWSDILS